MRRLPGYIADHARQTHLRSEYRAVVGDHKIVDGQIVLERHVDERHIDGLNLIAHKMSDLARKWGMHTVRPMLDPADSRAWDRADTDLDERGVDVFPAIEFWREGQRSSNVGFNRDSEILIRFDLAKRIPEQILAAQQALNDAQEFFKSAGVVQPPLSRARPRKDLLLYLRVLDATANCAKRADIVRVLYPNTDGRADSLGTLKDDIKAAQGILALRDLRTLRIEV